MNFIELVENTRSCRRFNQTELPEKFLESMVKTARVCPSSRNNQPLKFITIDDKGFKNRLFPHLQWAGSLKDWDGPVSSERPTAYIALVLDKTISSSAGADTGIMAQTMQLAAMNEGIASCMIGSFNKKEIEELLELDETKDLQLLLAFGYPLEKRVIVDVKDEKDTKYYRDENEVHYIPKRSLKTLLLKEF